MAWQQYDSTDWFGGAAQPLSQVLRHAHHYVLHRLASHAWWGKKKFVIIYIIPCTWSCSQWWVQCLSHPKGSLQTQWKDCGEGGRGGGVVTVNKKKLFSQKKNGDSCWSIMIRHYVWSVNWGTSWDLIFTQMPSTYLNQRLGGVPPWPTPSPQIECPGKQKSVISRRPWANVVIWSVKIKPLCYIIVYTIYCKLLDLSKVQAV